MVDAVLVETTHEVAEGCCHFSGVEKDLVGVETVTVSEVLSEFVITGVKKDCSLVKAETSETDVSQSGVAIKISPVPTLPEVLTSGVDVGVSSEVDRVLMVTVDAVSLQFITAVKDSSFPVRAGVSVSKV